MFFENRPGIHIVDEPTHFSAAYFLRNQSETKICRSIQDILTITYLGPPDHVWVDQGTNYVSNKMLATILAAGVTLKEAQIQSPVQLVSSNDTLPH